MKLIRTERRAEAAEGIPAPAVLAEHAIVDELPPFAPIEGEHYAVDDRGCWNWLGTVRQGYGFQGTWRAHRLSYATFVEPVNKGWHIHHLCENKLCINPKHLHQKHASWHIHDHVVDRRRVLTMDQARVIRRRIQTEPETTYAELAAEYGCSHGHIQDIGEGIAFWEPGVEWIKPTRPCQICGETIPPERRRHVRYCSPLCKQRAYNQRRQQRDPQWQSRVSKAYRERKKAA